VLDGKRNGKVPERSMSKKVCREKENENEKKGDKPTRWSKEEEGGNQLSDFQQH